MELLHGIDGGIIPFAAGRAGENAFFRQRFLNFADALRSGRGLSFDLLCFFLLELLELVCFDFAVDELVECVVTVFLWAGGVVVLCAETAGTVIVPAVRAARSSPQFLLLSNSRITERMYLGYLLSAAGTTPARNTVMI